MKAELFTGVGRMAQVSTGVAETWPLQPCAITSAHATAQALGLL